MSTKVVRIATRASALALWQARHVQQQLLAVHPGLKTKLLKITTTGDQTLNQPLRDLGGKALFLKEIEEALLADEADLAVHSLKDVPAELPEGLALGAILPRADPRDALILKTGERLNEGAVVATGSLRRRTQLTNWRPDLGFQEIRGNIDTRLDKLKTGTFDALVLAVAGLERMGWHRLITQILEPATMIPAIGQGALSIEIRSQDSYIQDLIKPLHHPDSACCVSAERIFSRVLGGNCSLPIAAWGRLHKQQLSLTACISDLAGTKLLKTELHGPASEPEHLGEQAAQAILAQGGDEIIRGYDHPQNTL